MVLVICALPRWRYDAQSGRRGRRHRASNALSPASDGASRYHDVLRRSLYRASLGYVSVASCPVEDLAGIAATVPYDGKMPTSSDRLLRHTDNPPAQKISFRSLRSPSTLPSPNRSPIVLVLELVLVLGFFSPLGTHPISASKKTKVPVKVSPKKKDFS